MIEQTKRIATAAPDSAPEQPLSLRGLCRKTHFGSSDPLTLSLSLREREPSTERRA